MSTIPTRFDGELFAAAKASGAINSRSAAQQLAHWARIGRELEMSPQVNNRAVQAVLAGDGSYDELAEREQAVVRVRWEEQIAEDIAGLDLSAELAATGEPWVVGDERGRAIERTAVDEDELPEA